MGTRGSWLLSSIPNSRHGHTGPIRSSAHSWGRRCEENADTSGMLKKAPNFVLGRSHPSTYSRSTARGPRSLRPRWLAILSIPKKIILDGITDHDASS